MRLSGESEKLYTAREAASELGLGAAMLRRYASSCEAVSSDAITVHRRDGRLFSETQLQVLVKARALVMRASVDVETAMKQALERPLEVAPVALAQSSALVSEAFIEALTAAPRAANEPLSNELRGVRELLERLEAQGGATGRIRQLEQVSGEFSQVNEPTGETTRSPQPSEHGLLVRFALWLEGLGRR